MKLIPFHLGPKKNETQQNTTLSEQFQNPIENSYKQMQNIYPPIHVHMTVHFLGTSIKSGGDKLDFVNFNTVIFY
jgi:hypothetical protein